MNDSFYYTHALQRALRDHGLASKYSVADVLAMNEEDALLLPGVGKKILTQARFEAPKVIVSSHPAFTDFLRELGLIEKGHTPRVSSPSIEHIWGKHIITSETLPIALARRAALVTEIPIAPPPALREKVLTPSELRTFSSLFALTYKVQCLEETILTSPKPSGAKCSAQ